jgi:hypothetical protein
LAAQQLRIAQNQRAFSAFHKLPKMRNQFSDEQSLHPQDNRRKATNKETLVVVALLTVVGSVLLAGCEDVTPTPTASPLVAPNGAVVSATSDVAGEITAALPAWLVELAAAIWAMPAVKFLVGQIALNTIVAVAVSLYTKTFELKKLADFLLHKIVPFILVYVGAVLFGEAIGLPALASFVLGLLETKLLAELNANLKVLGITQPAPAVV